MKKYITFIIFLMLLSISVLPNGESAGANITLEDWEDFNVGLNNGTGEYFDWETIKGSEGKIYDYLDPSYGNHELLYAGGDSYGTYSGNDETTWINATQDLGYVSSLMFGFKTEHIHYTASSGNMKMTIHIYNNSVEVLHLVIYNAYDPPVNNLYFKDSNDVTNYIHYEYDQSDLALAKGNLTITHVSGNTMNYTYTGSDGGSAEGGSYSTDDWNTFDSIKIETSHYAGNTWLFMFGDITISSQTQGENDECGYTYMTERYSHVGTINAGGSRQSNSKTIETTYNIPSNMNITGIDLGVASDQYHDDDNLSTYTMSINGLSLGEPDCWIHYGYDYILRWQCDVELSGESVLLEFTHNWHNYFGRNWQVLTGNYAHLDLDNDGDSEFKKNGNDANGVYDGTVVSYDIAYQIYYQDIQFPDDEEYYDNDYIYTDNSSKYCGEPVYLTYTLSTMASDTYLRIWNDDTSVEVNDGVFPYLCPTTTETIGFVTPTSANYTAKLYRNSVELDNVSFFVSDFKNTDSYIYTMPNPSYAEETYYVHYKYDNANNYSGAIFFSTSPDYKNYFDVQYIFDGESGSFMQVQNEPSTIYYILAVNKNNTYYIVNNGIHKHTIKSKTLVNYFELGSEHLTLQDGESRQFFSGETTHFTGNCKMYDNGKFIYTIDESPFSEYYTVKTTGNHKVEMRLITNETTVLYTRNYTVSGEEEEIPQEDASEGIREYISEQWGSMGLLIFTIAIIIGVMLIPLYVQFKANQMNVNMSIPWFTYIIFAVIGIIIDIIIGLIDLWAILLIVVISIAITVGIYFKR